MSNSRSAAMTRATTIGGIVVGLAALATLIGFLVVNLRGEDSETAKADFCDSASEFASTVSDYRALDPQTATTDEVRSASDEVESAWDTMVDDAEDWVNAYDNDLTNAYWDLYYAVEDLPGDNTLSENIDELQPELSAFPDAFASTFDGTGCTTA